MGRMGTNRKTTKPTTNYKVTYRPSSKRQSALDHRRGDWNQEPRQVTEIWEIGGEIANVNTATHEHGSDLDWYMVSNAIKGNWKVRKERAQPFQGHSPICLVIPGFTDLDLGNRLVNPKKN